MTYSFDVDVKSNARRIDAALAAYLSDSQLSGPGPAPSRLVAAMRHGTLNGGKRLRPLLVAQAAAIFGVGPEATVPAGVAVELVHCYSLVHDDLPAMDNDDLRRGQPTVHKAFDDATAILAGDALLTHAFALLSGDAAHPDPVARIRLVAELARGAGTGGMVGGQMRDIDGETSPLSEREISQMQAMKTGALIRAAVRMGAIIGGADSTDLDRLTSFAEAAGRAFQLADDILDVTATAAELGKATGKDHEQGKQTIVSRIGVDAARRQLGDVVHQALTALVPFGELAVPLRETARFFADRHS